MKSSKFVYKIIIGLLVMYLLIPIIGTFLFSIADKWDTTILPQGYTLHWYSDLFSDPRFFDALGRTIFLIVVTVGLSVLIMVPTIFIVTIYFRKWEGLLQAIAMLPYGIPAVVGSVGLIKLYSDGPIQISGTPWILIGAYFITILPFMYQGIRNSLRTINAIQLVDAAELLGASKYQAFRTVVLPNIMSGILASTLLSVAMLFGEFTFANLLVGGQFETIQIYLLNQMNSSGHLSSAIVISYYILIIILTAVVLKLSSKKEKKPIESKKKGILSIFNKKYHHNTTTTLEGEN